MIFAESMLNATTANTESIEESFQNPNAVLEMVIVDEVSQLPAEKIREFCAPGGVGETLVQEGKLRKNTLVKLNKKDDLSRRKTMMAMQVAKEKDDNLWKLLKKNRIKEKELLSKILKKYGNQGERLARKAQQQWLHGPKPVLPKNFQKLHGEDDDDEK